MISDRQLSRSSETSVQRTKGTLGPVGWDDDFDWPIPLPGGGELITFGDAGRYIEKLPKAEHDKPEWQLAIKDLMRAAAGHGPWKLLARIAIMRALRGKPAPPIGNPNDAPPAPKWRGRGKRDPWR